MKQIKRHGVAVFAGAALLGVSGASHGLGMGRASSHAILGEALALTVPVRLDAGEQWGTVERRAGGRRRHDQPRLADCRAAAEQQGRGFWRGDGQFQSVGAIERMGSAEFWAAPGMRRAMLARLPGYRLTKFQDCLPERFALEVIENYLLDVAGTVSWLDDDRREAST